MCSSDLADRAEIARSLAEPGVALEARVRRGAGLLFDRIARQAPLARLLMREAAETGERATYVLTQLMQPNLELYRPLWEEAMDAGILGRSDVVVAHTALVGAIASVISTAEESQEIEGQRVQVAEDFERGLANRALCDPGEEDFAQFGKE